jgi:single-strand DNA-binding protein
MLNRTILMGRLVADPELKTTASGVSVTSFRIAVDRSYVKSGEERKADFIDIVCWRQTADFVCRYFSKGSLIAVEGQLQSRTYQAKDGTNRYVVEVVADNVSFTGERRDANNYNNSFNQSYSNAPAAPAAEAQTQPAPSYQSGSNSDFQEMPLDDDLPF